jgi:hypothetical protein
MQEALRDAWGDVIKHRNVLIFCVFFHFSLKPYQSDISTCANSSVIE